MAELLGLVASGISVAQLAGTIITLGAKTRTLLRDIRDAPEEIQSRLEQLELIALSLQLHGDGGLGVTKETHPVLQTARLQCQKCLSELQAMLEDLSGKIQRSRGIRRKVALSKVMLKKEAFEKIERRLSHSVEVLSIAHQVYTIYLLQSQRRDFKSAIVGALESYHYQKEGDSIAVESEISRPLGPMRKYSATATQCGSRSAFRPWASRAQSRASWSLGIEPLTGVLEVEVSQPTQVTPTTQNKEDTTVAKDKTATMCSDMPWLRVRFRLPRWWSYKVIESAVYQAHCGWTNYFRTRNIISEDYPPWCKAHDNIDGGDMLALKEQFDRGELTPLDETYDGLTLIGVAVNFSRWDICNFLLDCGAEPYSTSVNVWEIDYDIPKIKHIEDMTKVDKRWQGTEYDVQQLRDMIQRDDQNDLLSFSLFRFWHGSAESFNEMRRSVWRDEEYYDDTFAEQRMRLAISLAHGEVGIESTASMVRYALYKEGKLEDTELDLRLHDGDGNSLIHCLAGAIGALQGIRSTKEYHHLTREVLRRSPNPQDLVLLPARSRGPDYETPLLRLIQQSLSPTYLLCCEFPYRDFMKPRFSHCGDAIIHWLEDLQACGLNLKSYGDGQKNFLSRRFSKRDFGPLASWDRSSENQGYVRLINFEYGELPSQWRFWWSEMTDEFVGQFWSLMETEREAFAMPIMPGSWVDGDSDDNSD